MTFSSLHMKMMTKYISFEKFLRSTLSVMELGLMVLMKNT